MSRTIGLASDEGTPCEAVPHMTSMRQKYDIIQASTNTTSAADSYAEMLAYHPGTKHSGG
ncbi:hypothetical protein OKW35_004553 [Paraburkholderia sp. MM5477-R1]